MAKTVFKSTEVKKSDEKVLLGLSKQFTPAEEPEVVEEVPVYEGPTVEDLKQEAEKFSKDWEIRKQEMITQANVDAENIKKQAEEAAFEEVKRKTSQAQVIKQQAEDEAVRIKKEAEDNAAKIIADAEQRTKSQEETGYKDGFEKGREAGFTEGKAEAQRLVDRLHVLIEKTMDKRSEILSETEQQIINLVLLMTRKVVKVISENQKNVIVANAVQALRKVKGRGDVTIRVNLADLQLTTQHIKDFLSAVENVKNISVIEDSTVDQGGCIIETDFGEIDAKISSQLNELEQRSLEVSPIRSKAKTVSVNDA